MNSKVLPYQQRSLYFGEYIGTNLRVLKQCFDEVSEFFRPEVNGQWPGAVGPMPVDVLEGPSEHKNQFLKLYPGFHVILHI